jgi:phospholipase/carboxylesterase
MTSYSVLSHRRVEPETNDHNRTLILLHDRDGGQDDLIPLGRSLGPEYRLVAPQAARGTHLGTMVTGQTWYGGSDLDKPEPASFGDSLAELERFVYDELNRRHPSDETLPFLIGVGEGAVMALSLSWVLPERVAGIVAIDGCFPAFRDFEPLTDASPRLPVLLIRRAGSTFPALTSLTATEEALSDRGAIVRTLVDTPEEELIAAIQDFLKPER